MNTELDRLRIQVLDIAESLDAEMTARLALEEDVSNLRERIITLESVSPKAHEQVSGVLLEAHDANLVTFDYLDERLGKLTEWWEDALSEAEEKMGKLAACRYPCAAEAGDNLPEVDTLSNKPNTDDQPLILRCDDAYWHTYNTTEVKGVLNKQRAALKAAILEVANWLPDGEWYSPAGCIRAELEQED